MNGGRVHGAQRIVCLTEETVEALYCMNEQARIVGVSGFCVRPPRVRREKPRVSAFTSAKIGKILELEPDLVLAFSDMQADIAAQLIRAGLQVHVFNQRSIAQILEMIETLGGLIGEPGKAATLIDDLERNVETVRRRAADLPRRPRVYFEEWNDPPICGIHWVSELIEIAGGEDVFGERSRHGLARQRIIADSLEVVRRAPDLIIGSWCGKKFQPASVVDRPGWDDVPAVRYRRLYEIKSCDILQPGPAALTDGLAQLHAIIAATAADDCQDGRR
jgi:iron complex transport system substrate-binding protein